MKFDRSCLKLYAVTDRSWLKDETLYQQVEKALKGGSTLVQLREKNLDTELFIQEAFQIKELCHHYHIPLIINDNLEVAKAVDADGIHIGQDDIDIEIIKKEFPNKIIGVTAHNLTEALNAQKQGATYLGMGAVFSTQTKKDASPLSIEELKDIILKINIPTVAIGGIKKENISLLKDTGIDGIAVVSAIFDNDDIEQACQELLKEVEVL